MVMSEPQIGAFDTRSFTNQWQRIGDSRAVAHPLADIFALQVRDSGATAALQKLEGQV